MPKTLTNLQYLAIKKAYDELAEVNKYTLSLDLIQEVDKLLGKDGDQALRSNLVRVIKERVEQWKDGKAALPLLYAIIQDESTK